MVMAIRFKKSDLGHRARTYNEVEIAFDAQFHFIDESAKATTT